MTFHAIGYLLVSLAKILSLLINLYTFILAGSVIVSWVNADPHNPIVRFLRQMTEPVLTPLRRRLPRSFYKSSLDFTPLILLIFLILLENVGVSLLYEWGQSFLVPR